jgi:hypothetical protein
MNDPDPIQPSPETPNPETPNPEVGDPGYSSVLDYLMFGLSMPERTLRSASGVLSGTLRESASLLVPQAFRSSKTYEVFVQQMLDFMAEDIGGVQRSDSDGGTPKVEGFVARKTVGNFIEMASLATVHLSPMTLLAIVSDVAYGSQAYLQELAAELQAQGVIDDASTIHHVDDLLAAVATAGKTTATAFDTPPLSIEGLRDTVSQTRAALASVNPASLLPQSEVTNLWNDIQDLAEREGVNPFALSGAMTLYSLDKVGRLGTGALSSVRVAGNLLDRHILDHYTDALQEIRSKGIYATLAESSRPYMQAVWANFSTERPTITEDLLSGKYVGQAWGAVRRWLGAAETPAADADADPPIDDTMSPSGES